MMLEGISCNLAISLIYSLLNLDSEKSVLIEMKLAVLVKRSTMIQMALFLRKAFDNPVIKSIVILYDFHSSTSNGHSKLEGLWCSTFTCWHIMHLATDEPLGEWQT